jgi:signal transduction histidine kinase
VPTQLHEQNEIAMIAAKILEAIQAPCDLRVGDAIVNPCLEASIGISVFPKDGASAAALIKRADEAMYRIIDGFTVDQVVGEFRALRASILRLWIERGSANIQADPTQITRFNESIDQMLTESVVRHGQLEGQAREHSTSRDAFLATLSHELRGPLAAIVNGVYIVKASGATYASLAPIAAMMSRQTQHLRRLLDDF